MPDREEGGRARGPHRWLSALLLVALVPVTVTTLRLWAPPEPPVTPAPTPTTSDPVPPPVTPTGTGLTPQAYAEQVLSLIGAHGIRGTHASWEAVRREALVLVAGVSSTRETHGVIQAALAASGTRGQLIRPEDGSLFPADPLPAVRPTTRGGVTSLAVPAVPSGLGPHLSTYAATLARAIAAAEPTTRCGWVLDLRSSRDHNPWPALAGVSALLGDGHLLSLTGTSGPATPVALSDGAVSIGEGHVESSSGSGQVRSKDPVAILLSSATAGGGEAIAAAFRHRPSTRTFGRPTQGDVTAARAFPLADGATLVLDERVLGPAGERFPTGLTPDVDVSPRAAEAAARAWLASLC